MNPGVHSSFPLLLSFAAATPSPTTIGVKLARVFGESLTGVRQSCPRFGERNTPVSSMTIPLPGEFEALDGKQGGGGGVLEGDFPARLAGDGEGGVTRFITVL